MKKKILFVCTGNTCRSPMAEAVFNDLSKKQNLQLEASSCGICGDGISKISEGASTALAEIGIDFEHISTPICEKLISDSDYIFGMTKNHGQAVIELFPSYAEKVYTLKTDITDPYGGDHDTYKKCLSEIILNIKFIIQSLSAGENHD